MLRSAQPRQFSTYPSQYIDTPVLAVLADVHQLEILCHIIIIMSSCFVITSDDINILLANYDNDF